ncbi:vascular cell adhesion protein 1-like [Contarinia nasturtii]|uniref:vascular cell adhesion protein 1-like n=1 Tax=Contarinia nasturtii TaxID=265458 RepID=UPI0012D43362|nr:vascular cell adhesion protein 1-like [Contarinia nasturtii]
MGSDKRVVFRTSGATEGQVKIEAVWTETPISVRTESQTEIRGNQTSELPPSSTEMSMKITPEMSSSMPFILLPPLLTISPNARFLNLSEGDQLMLICSAEGIPSPTVQWTTHNGHHNVKSETSIVAIEISNISVNESGTYICTATNDAGTAQESIQVSVQSKQTEIANSYEETENSRCLSGEFACKNGECIELSRVCDGSRDCWEGEDEDDVDLCSMQIDI